MTIRTEKPLDYSGQVWRGIDDKFPKKIHNATTTSDGLMSAEDKAKLDAININTHDSEYDQVTDEAMGFMTPEQKKILEILNSYYLYIQGENLKHVTDEQISYWDAKASTDVATTQINGLMSATDKAKLDGIEKRANNYTHPATHPATMIVQDEMHRFVSDTQIKYWDDKAENMLATQYSNGLLSASDKIKLDGIAEGANNYVHPYDENTRHVKDAEKEYWNSKADKFVATNTEDGLMAHEDKIKLDSIERGARNYIHPNDEFTRHVTDEQIEYWNAKADPILATTKNDGIMSAEAMIELYKLVAIDPDAEDKHYVSLEEKKYWNSKVNAADMVTHVFNGLMYAEDKEKLDGIEENANNYIHPDTHPATMIVEDETHRFMTDDQIAKLAGIEDNANKYIHPDTHDATMIVEDEEHRFMTDIQIAKLDSIEENANNYTHPETHEASMIVQDETHRFMNDEQVAKVDAIPEDPKYTDTIYEHPETHPATMIVEDETHRFVTDLEKEEWTAGANIKAATSEKDGLMSKEDKAKLDRLAVPETHEMSLSYSAWSGTAPYLQELNVPGISPDENAYIGIDSSATVQQMTIAAEAKLKVRSVEQDKVIIEATGVKPTIDLPIMVITGTNIIVFQVNQYSMREEYSDTIPTSGTHYQNEIIYSSTPVTTKCIGWVCIESGEPGQWKPFGTFTV